MIRFIFVSMAFIALSFTLVPMFAGISKEHQKLAQANVIAEPSSDSLTFEEIYALAGEDSAVNPAALNAIEPAAGGQEAEIEKFSTGFSKQAHPALAE